MNKILLWFVIFLSCLKVFGGNQIPIDIQCDIGGPIYRGNLTYPSTSEIEMDDCDMPGLFGEIKFLSSFSISFSGIEYLTPTKVILGRGYCNVKSSNCDITETEIECDHWNEYGPIMTSGAGRSVKFILDYQSLYRTGIVNGRITDSYPFGRTCNFRSGN